MESLSHNSEYLSTVLMNVCEHQENDVKKLDDGVIFVFGSNEAGIHGRGAARRAVEFGAVYGKGRGLAGQTFAIPTKDKFIQKISSIELQENITTGIREINQLIANDFNGHLMFFFTEIGCGLAGYSVRQVAQMVYKALREVNVQPYALQQMVLPKSFVSVMREYQV